MIKETRKRYAGLISEEQAEKLAFGEKFEVKKVFAPKKFSRGVLQRVQLDKKTLVLWNKETRFAGKSLRAGAVVGLKNFYEKNGELHSTKKLQVSVLKEAETLPLLKGEPESFAAFAVSIDGPHLEVAGKEKARITLWDSNAELAGRLELGERICFEGVRWSEGEGNAGWDCLVYPCAGSAPNPSEITREGVCGGKITALYEAKKARSGVLALIGAVDGERTAFFGADAARLLDADCDLPVETILDLKRRYIKGKTIVFLARRADKGLSCKQLLEVN
jgi:hypothetical protein